MRPHRPQRGARALALIAVHDYGRYQRAARRFLVRLLDERPQLTLLDAQLAAAALLAIPTDSRDPALAVLRALAS